MTVSFAFPAFKLTVRGFKARVIATRRERRPRHSLILTAELRVVRVVFESQRNLNSAVGLQFAMFQLHCALHAKFVLKEGGTRRQRSACFEFKAFQSASECCRTCRPNFVRMELKRGQRSRGREHPTQGRSPVFADLIVLSYL